MKLDFRDFYYFDSDYVDNLAGHIAGFIEEEYSETERDEKTNTGKGGANVGIVKGDYERNSTVGKEIARSGSVSPEIRFKKLFDALKELGLEQVSSFDEKLWNTLIDEGEFIEIRGSIQFTEVYNLEQQASLIGNLGSDLGFIDKEEAEQVLNQISKIKELQEQDGVPMIIETLDSEHKFVAYLNSDFLVKEQNDITGNDYKILCKIERKIPSGETYELFDIKELKRKTSNRAERRSKKNGSSLPKEIEETITGPAATILPIAIYR